MRRISVRLTEQQYEEIEILLASGKFATISEIVRLALKEFLESNKMSFRICNFPYCQNEVKQEDMHEFDRTVSQNLEAGSSSGVCLCRGNSKSG